MGRAVSSGCFRMFNADIIDLARRTPVGARVVAFDRLPQTNASPIRKPTPSPAFTLPVEPPELGAQSRPISGTREPDSEVVMP
nr:L,D-transpeptidase [Microvirga sp. VF16]